MVWLYFVELLGFGCRPCEGLECIEETTSRSLLVFEQASETAAVRFQENASLTITANEQATGLSTDWSVSAHSGEANVAQNISIGTSDGALYDIPWQIGETELINPTWILPSTVKQMWSTPEYRIASTPSDSTIVEGGGGVYIEDASGKIIVIHGENRLGYWPHHLWRCGDLDLDGIDDWIATDVGEDNRGELWLGLSTLLLDSSTTILQSSLPILTGDLLGEGFGHSLLCDRDWTDNGQIDLIVASPFANINGVSSAGRIQLLENNEGIFSSVDTLVGSRVHEWLGYRLTSGDIENDGRLELAATNFESQNTTVRLWTWTGDWNERYTLRSNRTNTFFGHDIEMADINGDEKDDLIIGEPYFTENRPEMGLVSIFKGTRNLLEWTTNFDVIVGSENYAHLGYSIDIIDANSDGIQDIILQSIALDQDQ